MNYACFPDRLPGLKCALLHPDPPRSFGCLVATNFPEEGLFVYLSSFLEKAIANILTLYVVRGKIALRTL